MIFTISRPKVSWIRKSKAELEQEPLRSNWYLSVPAVLIGLFLFGPLAFPLLWKSPAFTKIWKIFLTAVFTALTIWLLWGTGKIVEYVLQEFQKLQATLPT